MHLHPAFLSKLSWFSITIFANPLLKSESAKIDPLANANANLI